MITIFEAQMSELVWTSRRSVQRNVLGATWDSVHPAGHRGRELVGQQWQKDSIGRSEVYDGHLGRSPRRAVTYAIRLCARTFTFDHGWREIARTVPPR